jgi:hypothetical protein
MPAEKEKSECERQPRIDFENRWARLNLPSTVGRQERAATLFTMLSMQRLRVAANVLSIGTEYRNIKL